MPTQLHACSLFKGIDSDQTQLLIDQFDYQARSYARGDVIALQNTRYASLMILTEGSIAAETVDSTGNTLKVEHVSAPAIIAPTYLFAQNNLLPVNITAHTEAHITTIERDTLCQMMSRNQTLMQNFMEILSAPNTFISEKVVYLTYKTIKSKFANYLLNCMQVSTSSSFRNNMSQREMADMFAVTRPALARAIGELVQDGAIYVHGKEITILYAEKLKQYAKC